MLNLSRYLWHYIACIILFGILLYIAPIHSASANTNPKKQTPSQNHTSRIGDVFLRINLGTQFMHISNASGETIISNIGERAFSLLFTPEYGYFPLDFLCIFVSLPVGIDVDTIVGATWSMMLGFGTRFYYGPVFADIQLAVSFVSRSYLSLEFGGIIFGAGVTIPISQQFRLLLLAQAPLNIFNGFNLGLRGMSGLEIFF